jgi:hypothetical protein
VRYLKSLLVGRGMYLLAVGIWYVVGWMYWRHQFALGRYGQIVFIPYSRWNDFYAMLPLIIGHAIGLAAFLAGFIWMFSRISARNSN